MTVAAGSHAHFNYGFTAPGSYTVQFEASALLPDGTPTSSGPVSYQFEVVPEPGTIGLLAVAGLGLVILTVKRRRAASAGE